MDAPTTLSRTDPDVKRLLAITFPQYRGRRIRLTFTERMRLENYWSEGSRSYYVAVDLRTGKTSAPAPATHNPFNAIAHVDLEIPQGVAVVEHVISRGVDVGLYIHVRRESQTMLQGFSPIALGA